MQCLAKNQSHPLRATIKTKTKRTRKQRRDHKLKLNLQQKHFEDKLWSNPSQIVTLDDPEIKLSSLNPPRGKILVRSLQFHPRSKDLLPIPVRFQQWGVVHLIYVKQNFLATLKRTFLNDKPLRPGSVLPVPVIFRND